MTDPVQMLIDAGAIPTSPFSPSSRYSTVAIGRYQAPGASVEDAVAYALRRFIPQVRAIPVAGYHTVRADDRIDLLAANYLADVELTWRVADANGVTDMLKVTATPGQRIAIPLPPGAAGA